MTTYCCLPNVGHEWRCGNCCIGEIDKVDADERALRGESDAEKAALAEHYCDVFAIVRNVLFTGAEDSRKIRDSDLDQ